MKDHVNHSAAIQQTLLRALLICLLVPAAVASAEDRPLNAFNQMAYGHLKEILLRSAEKMPEESYAFKPTPAVRSYGQILGHVADAQYIFCSTVLGEKNPGLKIEQTRTSKADLIGALKDAFAYCDKAHDGMTDASAIQTVKMFGQDLRKVDVLTANNMHTIEHYGNLVTYMRLKNVVPPTSEQATQPKK
ncbi:MAG TPA: DinB family protein [Thermoanaerobaculia bacterium]|nr:DinB family protein [Thermoanaerobaculia bacterium]